MRRIVILLMALVALIAPTSLYASIIMDVVPSSAPNFFGSPSWPGYLSNGMSSLENSSGNIGSRATDPTAYEILGPVADLGDLMVSGFPSWRGVADPAPPFNGEFGNRLHFGLHVVGDMQFRLDNLLFNFDSTDAGNTLDFSGNFVGASYSATRVGVDYVDGIKGNGNDILYNSGPGTSLVNELMYIGVGNAFDATFQAGATNQDKMDAALASANSETPFTITMTYTLLDDFDVMMAQGSSVVTVPGNHGEVPEMASLATWGILAVCCTGAAITHRRRRR